MLNVLSYTILPIFSIILLGCLLESKKIIQPSFTRPANQIVFYLALPAMLFNATSRAPFWANFDLNAVIGLAAAPVILVAVGFVFVRGLKIPEERRSTFLHSGFHGNIGFMSYAVVYYALGESGFAKAAIMGSFLLVVQNLLALWVLKPVQQQPAPARRGWVVLKQILQNPIILSVVLGIACSLSGLSIPRPFVQSLEVLSGMALPMGLLLIGAVLSFGACRSMVREIIGIGVLKFACLPLIGYGLMLLLRVPEGLVLPGIILLAAPPATVTYVMATELGGNPRLAAASISVLTLVSAFTYSLVLACIRP
ncbi:MAG: AEC family transporter [Syntrophobacteraceae bacterium]